MSSNELGDLCSVKTNVIGDYEEESGDTLRTVNIQVNEVNDFEDVETVSSESENGEEEGSGHDDLRKSEESSCEEGSSEDELSEESDVSEEDLSYGEKSSKDDEESSLDEDSSPFDKDSKTDVSSFRTESSSEDNEPGVQPCMPQMPVGYSLEDERKTLQALEKKIGTVIDPVTTITGECDCNDKYREEERFANRAGQAREVFLRRINFLSSNLKMSISPETRQMCLQLIDDGVPPTTLVNLIISSRDHILEELQKLSIKDERSYADSQKASHPE